MDRIEKIREFLAANPQDAFLQHALALEYVKKGADGEARQVWEQLLNQQPGYVGSYYHLGKLLERQERNDDAIHTYEKGMEEAKKAGDHHAFGELRNACDELMG